MGKGSNTNTVTKDAEPWEGQAPYLRDLYAQAQNHSFYTRTVDEPSTKIF